MIVTLNCVSKIYQMGTLMTKALTNVSLSIQKGEFLCICGPSGSGKSTLLNLIGCLDCSTTGSVYVESKDVSTLSDNQLSQLRNQSIGFVFQSFNLVPVLTAFENIEYPLILQGVAKKDRYPRVIAGLQNVGLEKFAAHRPDELSGGQRQRVAIARALIGNPAMILADEPTANLDSQTGKEILEMMVLMNKRYQTTFVFSTHDPLVKQYASRVVHIKDGEIEQP